ncbi:hypothetical protein EYC84_001047 [Monilinia fructicola]|uniref:Uncharacterized protein n=1 Tax=Monilinia fructicola TaxID=38448 RepID=A0A5M9JM05_MONFR|nr:hypothetical protein EYC84_001047 [Monilinia fructicola]
MRLLLVWSSCICFEFKSPGPTTCLAAPPTNLPSPTCHRGRILAIAIQLAPALSASHNPRFACFMMLALMQSLYTRTSRH